MQVSLIVAMTERGVIGRDGQLPWHLSADLRRFKRITMGHSIVMGRKTYESIGRPLPGRTSIVISRQQDFRCDGVKVAPSLDEALRLATGEEVFIIGGAEIYQLALPLARRIHLTRVRANIDGDVFFPKIDWSQWQLHEETRHEVDEKNPYPYSFEVYDRVAT